MRWKKNLSKPPNTTTTSSSAFFTFCLLHLSFLCPFLSLFLSSFFSFFPLSSFLFLFFFLFFYFLLFQETEFRRAEGLCRMPCGYTVDLSTSAQSLNCWKQCTSPYCYSEIYAADPVTSFSLCFSVTQSLCQLKVCVLFAA